MPPALRPGTSAPLVRPVGRALGRRPLLVAAAAAVVPAGLLVTHIGRGPTAVIGDGLYAVLIYLLVALAVPRARAGVVAAIALVVCAVIELAQLTGVPATAVEAWPPLRYVLGTTFQATSLMAYTVGAALAAVVDRASTRRSRSPDERHPA